MNFDQTYIQVYCDLEFIIDTIYFNNISVQTGGGTYVFLRKHFSSLICSVFFVSKGNLVEFINLWIRDSILPPWFA